MIRTTEKPWVRYLLLETTNFNATESRMSLARWGSEAETGRVMVVI